MLAGAHKKFYRVQHAEIYLLDLKVQYKHKMKLPLDTASRHVFLFNSPDFPRCIMVAQHCAIKTPGLEPKMVGVAYIPPVHSVHV